VGGGSGGTLGIGGSAGAGGAGGAPADDPCPNLSGGGRLIDCSGQCAPIAPECSTGQCNLDANAAAIVNWPGDFPLVIRTASRPGLDPNCAQVCPGGGTAYGWTIIINQTYDPPNGFRARISPPWHVLGAGITNFCFTTGAPCSWLFDDGRFEFTTDKADAPARNVVIERLPNAMSSCP
jgi:hypothetical protein